MGYLFYKKAKIEETEIEDIRRIINSRLNYYRQILSLARDESISIKDLAKSLELETTAANYKEILEITEIIIENEGRDYFISNTFLKIMLYEKTKTILNLCCSSGDQYSIDLLYIFMTKIKNLLLLFEVDYTLEKFKTFDYKIKSDKDETLEFLDMSQLKKKHLQSRITTLKITESSYFADMSSLLSSHVSKFSEKLAQDFYLEKKAFLNALQKNKSYGSKTIKDTSSIIPDTLSEYTSLIAYPLGYEIGTLLNRTQADLKHLQQKLTYEGLSKLKIIEKRLLDKITDPINKNIFNDRKELKGAAYQILFFKIYSLLLENKMLEKELINIETNCMLASRKEIKFEEVSSLHKSKKKNPKPATTRKKTSSPTTDTKIEEETDLDLVDKITRPETPSSPTAVITPAFSERVNSAPSLAQETIDTVAEMPEMESTTELELINKQLQKLTEKDIDLINKIMGTNHSESQSPVSWKDITEMANLLNVAIIPCKGSKRKLVFPKLDYYTFEPTEEEVKCFPHEKHGADKKTMDRISIFLIRQALDDSGVVNALSEIKHQRESQLSIYHM